MSLLNLNKFFISYVKRIIYSLNFITQYSFIHYKLTENTLVSFLNQLKMNHNKTSAVSLFLFLGALFFSAFSDTD